MSRIQGVLVAAEAALAVILVVRAGLMGLSMANRLRVDPGFHAAQVLTQRIQLPQMRYPSDARVREFCNEWPIRPLLRSLQSRCS